MIRCFLVLLLGSCLAAPAFAQSEPGQTPPVATSKPTVKKSADKALRQVASVESGPCQVGVIPMVGDHFVYQKIGFTVFGNERVEVPISGWALDGLIVARVRAAAGAGVRRIAYRAEEMIKQDLGSSPLFPDKPEFVEKIRALAGNAGCTRYVVVTRFPRQFVGNQSIEGIGVVNNGSKVVGSSLLFASVYIWILGGQDFKAIKQGPSSISDNSSGISNLLGGGIPTQRIDNSSFPDSPDEAAKTPAIRDGARALLATSLDRTLPGMLKP